MPGSPADKSSLRIGLFGGTFDPPHIGHLVVADQVKQQLDLDQVLFMVANVPWQKEGTRQISSSEDRVSLAICALEDSPQMSVSDLEIRMGGNSYTINTVAELKREYEFQGVDVEVLLILGSDAAGNLDTWHKHEELRDMVEIVVVNRPGNHQEVPEGWKATHVTIPPLDISSTQLRTSVAQGQSIRYLVTDSVLAKIKSLGLYVESF